MKPERRIYCRYCGAKLKRDTVGMYCPTKNCQWSYTGTGMSKEDEFMRQPAEKEGSDK